MSLVFTPTNKVLLPSSFSLPRAPTMSAISLEEKALVFFHFYYISRGLKAHWTKNPKQFRNPFNFSIKFCCFESNFWPVDYKETFLLFFLFPSGINEFMYYKYIWSQQKKNISLITNLHLLLKRIVAIVVSLALIRSLHF